MSCSACGGENGGSDVWTCVCPAPTAHVCTCYHPSCPIHGIPRNDPYFIVETRRKDETVWLSIKRDGGEYRYPTAHHAEQAIERKWRHTVRDLEFRVTERAK